MAGETEPIRARVKTYTHFHIVTKSRNGKIGGSAEESYRIIVEFFLIIQRLHFVAEKSQTRVGPHTCTGSSWPTPAEASAVFQIVDML